MPALSRSESAGAGVAFEPINRATISTQIRDQLYERITRGDLAPGARVPSERDLTEQFGVARTSVREAMHALVSLGVVERRGNRVFVAEHLPEVSLPETEGRTELVRQLFETRRVLEPTIFELAAERADDADRRRITDLAEEFGPGLELETFRTLDRRFHQTIAAACGNPLLIELYGKVLERLFQSDEFDSLLSQPERQEEVDRLVKESGEHHAAIASAIEAGDPAGARTAAEEHLCGVEAAMVEL